MRLIDADALGIGRCNPDLFPNRAYAAGWNGVINLIQDAPTVDAVEVVRCKDCGQCYQFSKQGAVAANAILACIRHGAVYPDGYCSHGERRESEDNHDQS